MEPLERDRGAATSLRRRPSWPANLEDGVLDTAAMPYLSFAEPCHVESRPSPLAVTSEEEDLSSRSMASWSPTDLLKSVAEEVLP